MEHDPNVKHHCAEAYMLYVRSLVVRVNIMRDEIERQKALLQPLGVKYSDSVSQNVSGDSMENGVIKLQEMIAEYTTELLEYVEQQRIAHEAVGELSKPERTKALTCHYLQGLTWEETCVKMSFSWHGMMKLRKKALIELYDHMPERWRRDPIPNALPQSGH